MRWCGCSLKCDSILQLTEGGHSSLATEDFAKSVQRNNKRNIGLSIAGHIGGTVTKGTGVDRDFEGPACVALSDIADQQVGVHVVAFFVFCGVFLIHNVHNCPLC